MYNRYVSVTAKIMFSLLNLLERDLNELLAHLQIFVNTLHRMLKHDGENDDNRQRQAGVRHMQVFSHCED